MEAERAGGPLLGAVVGVVQTSDSTVFVLDQKWQKIVGFRPDGSYARVILGGAGDGPGEFRVPVHMALSPTGLLAVLDFDLSRVTFFDAMTGAIKSQVALQVVNPLRLLFAGDRIWIGKGVPPGSTGSPAIAFDQAGKRVDAFPEVSDDDRAYGSSVSLAADRQGTVLHASRRPGLWEVKTPSGLEQRESALFPRLKPPELVREDGYLTIGSMEAETGGIAYLGPDRVLLRYRTQKLKTRPPFPDPATVRQFFGVFDEAGKFQGTIELPAGRAMDGNRIYVSPLNGT